MKVRGQLECTKQPPLQTELWRATLDLIHPMPQLGELSGEEAIAI